MSLITSQYWNNGNMNIIRTLPTVEIISVVKNFNLAKFDLYLCCWVFIEWTKHKRGWHICETLKITWWMYKIKVLLRYLIRLDGFDFGIIVNDHEYIVIHFSSWEFSYISIHWPIVPSSQYRKFFFSFQTKIQKLCL